MFKEEAFVKLVADLLQIEPAEVVDDLAYNSIPLWDSVAHMSLVAALEATYGVTIDTDDILAMSNIGEVRATLMRYISNAR